METSKTQPSSQKSKKEKKKEKEEDIENKMKSFSYWKQNLALMQHEDVWFDETFLSADDTFPDSIIKNGFKYTLKEKNENRLRWDFYLVIELKINLLSITYWLVTPYNRYIYQCEDFKKLKCRALYSVNIKGKKVIEKLTKGHALYQNYSCLRLIFIINKCICLIYEYNLK